MMHRSELCDFFLLVALAWDLRYHAPVGAVLHVDAEPVQKSAVRVATFELWRDEQ